MGKKIEADINIKWLLRLNLLTSSYYMLAYLCLTISMSYILSSSIFVFSLFTGIYLMSMGIGSILINKIPFSEKNIQPIILSISIIGILLINPGVIGLMYLNEYLFYIFRNSQTNYINIILIYGISLTIFIGILSGSELPLFSKLLEAQKKEQSELLVKVLSFDYFGTCIGVILFNFLMFPFWGLTNSILISQSIAIIGLWFIFYKMGVLPNKFSRYLILVTLYCMFSIMMKDEFLLSINKLSF